MSYFWNILTPGGNFEFLSLLALAAAKATVLLIFAALLSLAFRRFSAATRHLFWTSALCAALLLPFLSFLNFWEVPVLPAQFSANAAVTDEQIGSGETAIMPEMTLARESLISEEAMIVGEREKFEFLTKSQSLENFSSATEMSARRTPSPEENTASLVPQSVNWALAVWVGGVLLLLLRLLVGFAASNFLVRRGAEFKDAALNELFSVLCAELDLKNKIRLLRSERTLMPVACGIFRSVVLLPAGAEKWSAERQRMVLLHELAHVARRDCLTQMLAQTAGAFYWFNPLVWFAVRRLRVERERACDDRVLSLGTKPSEYAGHLLEIARSMQEKHSTFAWSQTTSVAMARRSQLEGRLLAILSGENKPGRLSRAATAVLVALVCVLLVSLAIVRPTAIKAQNSQTSETASNDNNGETETSLLDSFSMPDSKRNDDEPAIHDSKTDKAVEKPNDIDASDKDSREMILGDGRNDKTAEQKVLSPSVESVPSKSVSETVEPQITATPQTPEIVSPPDAKINLFVNSNYERKPTSEGQEKSGDFIDEMASVGLTNLSVDELVTMKIHGVTADFVRRLRALGFNNLMPKTVTNLRIYRVTPAYIEAMAAAGYKGLTLKELTNARIYNVTPEYVKAIQNAGYPSLSIGQIMEFKIYKITPELVQAARVRLGNLTPKQMISLKNSGVLNKVADAKKDTK